MALTDKEDDDTGKGKGDNGDKKSVDGSMFMEENDSIKKGCENVRDFLRDLGRRGREGLSAESCEVIEEMENDLSIYLIGKKDLETGRAKNIKLEKAERTEHSLKNIKGTGKKNSKYKVEIDSDDYNSYEETSSSSSNSNKADKKRTNKLKNKKKMYSRSRLDDSISDNTETSASNTSGSEAITHCRKKDKKKNRRDRSIKDVLRTIDNRKAPLMDTYNEENGQDLGKYLDQFEMYCEENVRGGDRYWIKELESHLEGMTLDNFKRIRDYDDDYMDVKYKLMKSYKSSSNARKKRTRRKFENAKLNEKESLYIFSIRLENLFKRAYPFKKPKKSSTLIKQFKKSIPRAARDMINSQMMAYKLKNMTPNWELIQKCVRLKDIDDEVYEVSSEEETMRKQPKEIAINLGGQPQIFNGNNYSSGRYQNQNNRDRSYRGNANQGYRNQNGNYRGNGNQRNRSQNGNYRGNHNQGYRNQNGNYRGNNNQGHRNQSRNYRENQIGQKNGSNEYQDERVQRNNQADGNNPESQTLCYTCNRFGHISRGCPVTLGLCFICGEKGHFARECPQKRGRDGDQNPNRESRKDQYDRNKMSAGGAIQKRFDRFQSRNRYESGDRNVDNGRRDGFGDQQPMNNNQDNGYNAFTGLASGFDSTRRFNEEPDKSNQSNFQQWSTGEPKEQGRFLN